MRRGPWRSAYSMLGRVSRMRVSSMTRPSSSGTLKSTRMKMRRSLRGRSRIESLDMENTPTLIGVELPLQTDEPGIANCGASLRGADEGVRPYAGIYRLLAAIGLMRSRTRQELPNSLSYQEIN